MRAGKKADEEQAKKLAEEEVARQKAIEEATKQRQQEEAMVKAHYQQIRQPTVPYDDHVEKLDATSAVGKYRPNVVIACWVTHLFDADRPSSGGSVFGVSEKKDHCIMRRIHLRRQ